MVRPHLVCPITDILFTRVEWPNRVGLTLHPHLTSARAGHENGSRTAWATSALFDLKLVFGKSGAGGYLRHQFAWAACIDNEIRLSTPTLRIRRATYDLTVCSRILSASAISRLERARTS